MPWPAEAPHRPSGHLRALLSCETVSDELPLIADGTRRPHRSMQEHLAVCPRCQADLAGYRRLLLALRGLRDQAVLATAPDLVDITLEALHGDPAWPGKRAWRSGWAVAGALVASFAAVGAGALVARSWHTHLAAGA